MLRDVLCCPTFVPMMQTAHLRQCDHSPRLRRLHWSMTRGVLLQRKVRPALVIVIHERLDVPVERSLVKHDQPSRPGDLHPEALTEPDISLSTYPARATE
jgi:hypothetical protein